MCVCVCVCVCVCERERGRGGEREGRTRVLFHLSCIVTPVFGVSALFLHLITSKSHYIDKSRIFRSEKFVLKAIDKFGCSDLNVFQNIYLFKEMRGPDGLCVPQMLSSKGCI